nr:Stk1 family PASTA domain-containing Ser/Thr kinase [uncultured Peptostreptococcus sp.]
MGATVLGNRYEILRKIGDGGMAFVYQARDKLLNRIVAVKVLRPEFVDDQEFLVKFKREAEAVASLSHPNIVNVYDVGEDGKVHYIVMEYVDGQNLKEIIQDEGFLEKYTALDIAKQIARALSAAHRNGIIHRDIKPHNILISKDGRQVKVADFGIAKAVSSSTMTNMGSVIGSVHYISPEQAKGKHLTSNADLYSLGIVLYEMIVGKVPFSGDSPISIALKHINEDISFSEQDRINIPNSVRTIISKLTQKEPANRYQTAEELIEDIDFVEKNINLPHNIESNSFNKNNINDDYDKDYVTDYDDDYEPDYDEYYEDEYYDDDDGDIDNYYAERPNTKKSKVKSRKKDKKSKKETPRARRRLKILAFVLIMILMGYVVFFMKYFGLGIFNKDSSDNVTVPSVVNMTIEEAQKSLEGTGLKLVVRSEEYSNGVSKDRIITQTPSENTSLKKGDSVSVVVSKGNSKVPVPNVVGLKLSQAERLLNDNKLVLGNVKYEYNDALEGTVLSQSLVGGSSDEGQKVSLVVSKGKKSKQEKPSIIEDDSSDGTDSSIMDNGSRDIDPSNVKPSRTTRPNNTRPNHNAGGRNSGNGSNIIVPDNSSDSSSGTTSENIIGGTNN